MKATESVLHRLMAKRPMAVMAAMAVMAVSWAVSFR
jgi:hypothetical protein